MNEKELKIYDILYDLYVDDTDCTQCAWYDDCSAIGRQCAYNEKFFATEQIKEMLSQKASEIYKICTK